MILVSLMVTLFSEKMILSTRCIHGFMPNSIKKFVTVSMQDYVLHHMNQRSFTKTKSKV